VTGRCEYKRELTVKREKWIKMQNILYLLFLLGERNVVDFIRVTRLQQLEVIVCQRKAVNFTQVGADQQVGPSKQLQRCYSPAYFD
jgi:hypothetical protein